MTEVRTDQKNAYGKSIAIIGQQGGIQYHVRKHQGHMIRSGHLFLHF